MKTFYSIFNTIAAAALIVGLSGCSSGVKHEKVVNPKYSISTPQDLSAIGYVTTIKESGGVLYVGARKGLGALDAQGKLLWKLELPAVDYRLIDVDNDSVAFSGFNVEDREEAKFLGLDMGRTMVKISGARVGVVSKKGDLAWTTESAAQYRMSAPALGKNAIGVTSGKEFLLFDRSNGKLTHSVGVGTHEPGGIVGALSAASGLGMLAKAVSSLDNAAEKELLSSPVMHPFAKVDKFYVGHHGQIAVISDQGKVLESESGTGFGLFSPFYDVAAGPVEFDDKIVFASLIGTPGGDFGSGLPRAYAVDDELDKEWVTDIKSVYDCGVSTVCTAYTNSITSNKKQLFVATKLTLTALDDDGDVLWHVWNRDGGLYSGAYRYAGSPGAQMVATDDRVYITTSSSLTVVKASSGDYVESIKTESPILDMAILGNNLALATENGLKFVALR